LEYPKGKDYLVGTDERIILKLILRG